LIDLAEPLRRFVRTRVRDAHEADDIVQDVLLKAIANPESMPPDKRLAAWMFRAARNLIIDRYRSRRVREAADIEKTRPMSDQVDDEDQAQVVAELAACLGCMVDRLAEPYRDALKLADLQGLTQQDIASKMGISLSGAKSRVQRARQQLQSVFSACCNIERDARGNVTDFQPNDRARPACPDDGCDPDSSKCR